MLEWAGVHAVVFAEAVVFVFFLKQRNSNEDYYY